MNNADKEYQRLLELILTKGRRKKNRTGTDTIGVFGAQARFNLQEGFPLLTTKKMFSKGIIHELLWFISGSTNIKYLVDNGVNIWNKDAYRRYLEVFNKTKSSLEPEAKPIGIEEFVESIKTDYKFAREWGELGEGTYGGMWRGFPYAKRYTYYSECSMSPPTNEIGIFTVDQLAKAIEKLKTNPDDRRIIVSAWHPYHVDHCVLPPCHVLFHFNTEELTIEERWNLISNYNWDTKLRCHKSEFWKADMEHPELFHAACDQIGVPRRRLNCLMYQRSCDTFLGVPFNIASYALLTELVAHCVNMVAGEFIHTYGDLHLYENHIEQAREQLKREPLPLSRLKLNPQVRDLFAFKFEDITIENYQSQPPIKGEMST
jgi:thymidylate synthase